MIITAAALKAAAAATSKDDTRYALNSVEVRPDGSAWGTDGHLAIKVTDRYPGKNADFPGTGIFHEEITEPQYLARETIDQLSKVTTTKKAISILGSVQIGMNGDGPFAQATNLTTPITAKLPQGEDRPVFPNIEKAIPKDRPIRVVSLGIPVLEALIKAVKAIGGKAIDLELPAEAKYWEHQTCTCGHKATEHSEDAQVCGHYMGYGAKACSCPGFKADGSAAQPHELQEALTARSMSADQEIFAVLMPMRK